VGAVGRAAAARLAKISAPSQKAMSSPMRKRMCWLRVRRPVRQASRTIARASQARSGDVGADRGCWACSRAQLRSLVAVVAALGLEVLLPAVAGDGHLHDLGGALVDRRDPHVALDLLDDIRPGVAVAAVGLDGVVGRRVARLGGEVLGDRAFGVHRAVGPRPRSILSAVSSMKARAASSRTTWGTMSLWV
jgi:hypothetical protein